MSNIIIQSTNWDQINTRWKTEEDNERWRSTYESSGFSNWDDWRYSIMRVLNLDKREWQLETPENPTQRASDMYCNALTVWNKFYDDRSRSTFKDVIHHPTVANNKRILEMRTNFPSHTQCISLRLGNREIAVDGHHRVSALAGFSDHEALSQHQVSFAVSDFTPEEGYQFEKIWSGNSELKIMRAAFHIYGLIKSQRLKQFQLLKSRSNR